MRAVVVLGLGVMLFFLAGCGGGSMNPACSITGVSIDPAMATANHAAAPPGNQAVFTGHPTSRNSPGCPAITSAQMSFTWFSNDPNDVTLVPNQPMLGSATAICKNATPPGGAQIKATLLGNPPPANTTAGFATLTCQ